MTDLTATRTPHATRHALVDSDIHVLPAGPETLRRFLPERWRIHDELFGNMPPSGADYPVASPYAARADSWPPGGGPPGGDLGFLRTQLLDAWNVSVGILNPLLGAFVQRNVDYGAALASAANDWLIEEWLEPEPRLRGSITVAQEDGDLAAREIDRVGTDPRFVQVLLRVRTAEPLGRRKYWPLYAAAVRHGLPVGLHVGGASGWPVTGAGFHSFHFENHSAWPGVYQSQIASLITEGVFDRFPDLRIVLIEGGFAWLAALMWRFDDAHRRLSSEVPDLQRRPSEYIRSNFWVTTQPMEEPANPTLFRELLVQMDMDDRLLFATDYPHWDFDAPDMAIPVRLEQELERAIMGGNASRLYRLDRV